MKTKDKLNIEDFHFYEKTTQRPSRYDEPVINISKNQVTIAVNAVLLTGIKDGDIVILSKHDDDYYFAIIPIYKNIKGFKAKKHESSNVFSFSMSNSTRDIEQGIYKLEEPVFVNEIDFFKLTKYVEKATE